MSTVETWLFVFAALGGLGGLAGVLVWLEVRPKHVMAWFVQVQASEISEAESPIIRKKWKLVAAIILFALSFASSGVGFYLLAHRSGMPDESWLSQKQETIYARSYQNETVELDGKNFDHCHFSNVKLNFHGRAPFSFIQSDFNGEIWFGTDNVIIKHYMKADAALNKLGVTIHRVVCLDSHGNPISDPASCPQ
jgi:hypothetical protein